MKNVLNDIYSFLGHVLIKYYLLIAETLTVLFISAPDVNILVWAKYRKVHHFTKKTIIMIH